MASSLEKTKASFMYVDNKHSIKSLIQEIQNREITRTISEQIPSGVGVSHEGTQKRWEYLRKITGDPPEYLMGEKKFETYSDLRGNIENYIGMSLVPTGIVGPVRVIGSSASGDYIVPMATSEGTLVASYNRGARACYLAGGITSICLIEGVQRSPVFKFNHLGELGTCLAWVLENAKSFQEVVEQHSRYAKLTDMITNIEGNHLILTFEFHVGDASGQNMVTLCTDAICSHILNNIPVKPCYWFIESNYSGDKKATALSFTNVRGKKVTAEIILPSNIIEEVLKSTTEQMTNYWRSSTMGTIQSGSIGAQGHYANGLAAVFIATGQDVACVAEAATGITRMEITNGNALYASVTLPNLIVGTVGGGTSLPTQHECLKIMDCQGAGNARKFAEICGATLLCGELSIAAAISAGQFAAAHKIYGRKR